ncbi:L,D-transpeptidase family protein [Undibacterium sp. Jales W-56]|uniref:L,D-transpeptidase family protein n=1 Tax=Undibacterium sp. Jales W-56 TaxID=2897325 RepID=UPI0021D3AFB6|nr:L,D-transpeptidase family protein [Undibacterium sp. Jales W-56]MCU6433185.1 L,D-transpeptidase family protein [Undibacterium sp. Jales W-56]
MSAPTLSHAKSRVEKSITPEASQHLPNPDFLLLEVYKSLAANKLQQAQLKADELVEAYPNFQLGHLIRGDLLLMHTKQVNSFGGNSNASPEKLKDLRDEAYARLKSIREKPDPDLIPRNILQLRDDQKQILIMDAKKSRLYLYENNAGQPKFVTDFYVSQGKFGINKNKEGDQKTPVGVYYITSRLAGSKLPDFYGPGALPINYPNEWDKINGRSGSGIWLHGVPSENFSRPPLASDGCVVLTNPDFLRIAAMIDIGKTPVIISEQVEFSNFTKWNADKQSASKMLEDWRTDLESQNPNRLLNNYSRNFKTIQGDNLNVWFPKQQQAMEGLHNLSIKLKEVTQFRYPGKDEMIVSTFTQETTASKSKTSVRKRQYWIKEAAKWRIIYEAQV